MRPICYIVIALLTSACITSAPRLSPQQLRAIQVRTYESSDIKNTFYASKEVLQDEGYLIKKQDFSGGMLVAEKKRTIRSPEHRGRVLEEEVDNLNCQLSDGRTYSSGRYSSSKKVKFVLKNGKLIRKKRDSRYGTPCKGRVIIQRESPEFNIMEGYSFTVNLEELNKKDTKVRIGIERTLTTNKGNKTSSVVVSQPQYLSFYNKMKVELERRKIYKR